MKTVILVPWRGGDAHRERLWAFVRPLWERFGWPVVEGRSPAGPFNRSAAVNDAARRAGAWDIAVIIDADTYVLPAQVRRAIATAQSTGSLSYPHTRWRGLSASGTRVVMAGYRGPWDRYAVQTLPMTVSSCLAVPRGLWETVGGMDERFRGWGFEDRAFHIACDTFGGVERIPGPVFHLWHTSKHRHRRGEVDYQRNQALSRRYRAAWHDRAAVARLLSEARAA